MRVAFNIHNADTEEVVLELFRAVDMQDGSDPITIRWGRSASKLEANPTFTVQVLDGRMRSLMAYVASTMEEHGSTPLKLARAILGLGGCQVVYDEGKRKYRNLATAQDGAKVWALVGTKLTVTAPDEDEACKRAPQVLTRAMQDKPEDAPQLAKWYAGGKVKLVDSSEDVPDPISNSKIADVGEQKLVDEPIKKLSGRRADAAANEAE